MDPNEQSMELTDVQRALIEGLREDAANRYLDGDLGALDHSVAHHPRDAAFWMLLDGKTSTPVVHRRGCYICEDPEYAAMGLPLCWKCPRCGGHIAADDENCDDCMYCINPGHQTGADGLDPDGFGVLPADDEGFWVAPYGDFETREPFLVVTGERYDGLPLCFGDLADEGEKDEDDYVTDLTAPASWRGLVTEVKRRPVLQFNSDAPFDGSKFAETLVAYECTVEVRDPGSSGRQRGDVVRCLPQWLRVIRKGAGA